MYIKFSANAGADDLRPITAALSATVMRAVIHYKYKYKASAHTPVYNIGSTAPRRILGSVHGQLYVCNGTRELLYSLILTLENREYQANIS